MSKYKSYHTSLKQLSKRNKLPAAYLHEIDRSTIWRWRNESNDKYCGSELSNIEVLEHFITRKEAQKIMKAYLKVAVFLSGILNLKNHIKEAVQSNMQHFLNLIEKHKNILDRGLLLRLCKISSSVFYFWKNTVLKKCAGSPVSLCKKTFPGQLTVSETTIMKNLLNDERFMFWPVCSIAYYALREKLVSVSLSTWYYYIRKLGLKRLVLSSKKKYAPGIRGERPDQVWHADITVVKTNDGKKHYVYLLMDNFSRLILNWRIEERVCSEIRVDTIREALKKNKGESLPVTLITDGGPENDNNLMKRLVSDEVGCFKTFIALRDVPFSNSIIEAQNKVFKYRYLFRQNYETLDELKTVFGNDVKDFNFSRPHISLKGYTPYEVHSGQKGQENEWRNNIENARRARIAENRKQLCEICK